MDITLRKFKEEDIPYKVAWINNPKNNKYLHYDLPLREDKTLEWFKTLDKRFDRVDYTILYKNQPVGLIGLIAIENRVAEYYICLGSEEVKGKGIAKAATELLIQIAYEKLSLEQIYLFTEVENISAQKLFETSGFVRVEKIENDLFYNDRHVDRYKYVLDLQNYMQQKGLN